MEFIDVKINPLPPAIPINIKVFIIFIRWDCYIWHVSFFFFLLIISYQTALWWASEKEPDCGAGIDWHCFIKDLDIKTHDDTLEFNEDKEKEHCETKKWKIGTPNKMLFILRIDISNLKHENRAGERARMLHSIYSIFELRYYYNNRAY